MTAREFMDDLIDSIGGYDDEKITEEEAVTNLKMLEYEGVKTPADLTPEYYVQRWNAFVQEQRDSEPPDYFKFLWNSPDGE